MATATLENTASRNAKDADIAVSISMDATIYKESDGVFFAYCHRLGTYSQGCTVEEARKMLIEATELMMEDYKDINKLNEHIRNSKDSQPDDEYLREFTEIYKMRISIRP